MADLQLDHGFQLRPDIHKFGGSSLKDAPQISKVVATIQSKVNQGDFIVVSANGKVTDYLWAMIQGQEQALVQLTNYLNLLIESVLLSPKELLKKVNLELNRLSLKVNRSVSHQQEVLAMGELWSAQLLSAKLAELQLPNSWLDAREYIVVDEQNQLANRAIASSQLMQAVNLCSDRDDGVLFNIITGYIASDLKGNSITLGRNGSDYSATLIADLVQSTTVYLWTDVDGVYTADPHVISDASSIDQLTISEAQALSELGSNVLHQQTIAPILQRKTCLEINTCGSQSNGTLVNRSAANVAEIDSIETVGKVKTLAHKSDLVFLSLSQVNELKARQFQTQLTVAQINNYANHFDKTQHVLSFYIENKDLFKTTQLINSVGMALETQLTGVSLVSAVGQSIRQNHHVITKVLNRSAKFAVHNIHYPANDHTLCVLLPDEQALQLLHDLHQTFFALEPSIPIVVLGFGNIGKQFLKILKANKNKIEKNLNQSLSVVAVANSRYFQFNDECLLNQTIELSRPNQNGELLQELQVYAGKPVVVIDLTASDWVAKQYLSFAQNGWHLISANKIATADDEWAQSIEHSLMLHNRHWLKNTTVGAALPIQQSIRQVIASGDQIKKVSGVFSGSLSWLFGQYDGQTEFMDWVKQAQKNTFTEPDPREDLSGQDVYRKALILARELGFEPTQIHFKAVIPAEYLSGSIEDFWRNQDDINSYIKSLWQGAKNEGQHLRYLASVSANELRIELIAVDDIHPAAGLKPGDNIFIIESDWYSDNPLVIQGPGAGREVTAAGVLTDLIEVLQSD